MGQHRPNRQRRGVRWSILAVSLVLLGLLAVVLRTLLPLGQSASDRSISSAAATGSPEPTCVVPVKPGDPCPTSPEGTPPTPKDQITFSPIPTGDVGPSYPYTPGSIFTDAPEPFSTLTYSIQNSWWDVVGDQAYEAWAGALTSDPSQGVVVLMTDPTSDVSQSSISIRDYPTPTAAGSVTISQASRTTLTLVASDGTTFTFDAETGLYS